MHLVEEKIDERLDRMAKKAEDSDPASLFYERKKRIYGLFCPKDIHKEQVIFYKDKILTTHCHCKKLDSRKESEDLIGTMQLYESVEESVSNEKQQQSKSYEEV